MKNLYYHFLQKINGGDLIKRTAELCKKEAPQTFQAYNDAADHIISEMNRYGLPNAEKVMLPADGTTSFEDAIMPIAWDASCGKLTLFDKERTVAADYSAEPLSLVKGSVATAPGGEIVRIITEQQLLNGEDSDNALVMLSANTFPQQGSIKNVLDLKAKGFITDDTTSRYISLDSVMWRNGCTETNAWHVIEGDRDFIGFSVTPKTGDKIRQLASQGELKAKIECDGRRYKGTFPAVTALLPGRRKEELWLIAHAFEPFLDDDAAGITASLEIMRLMKEAGLQEYSLRVIFTLELYGFAAYHALFKGDVIGACNLDALACLKHTVPILYPPVPGKPFHGVPLMHKMYDELHDEVPMELRIPQCFDDMTLCDSTVGVPVIWIESAAEKGYPSFWHNSHQREIEMMDGQLFASSTALAAAWTAKVLSPDNDCISNAAANNVPQKIADPLNETPWRKYAGELIYKRISAGLPKDLAKVPREERRILPDKVIYGPFGTILTRLDGKKTLLDAILETEQIKNTEINDETVKKYIDALNYLCKWGYAEAVKRRSLTQEDLRKALEAAGIEKGDMLLVHSSVSSFGHLENGAETLIRAIKDATGNSGTMLFPVFTRPYIMLGGVLNRNWNYRPYDSNDLSQIWTGQTGKVLLKNFPDAIRSAHITHSWAGIGPLAAECLSKHGFADAPAGHDSPLGEALRHNGKILFAGCGLAPNTFLHYIETEYNLPYLREAVCSIRNSDGTVSSCVIEKHLPGHRNFYGKNAENGKFYKKAFAAGLTVREAEAGLGKLQVIGMRDMWNIGSALLEKDSDIFLCDDPECVFCSKYRKLKTR